MDQAVWFRWLGVAGIEVRVNEQILAIDPFLTRPHCVVCGVDTSIPIALSSRQRSRSAISSW